MDIAGYPGKIVGILQIEDQLYNVFSGADFDNDAILDLPPAGGAFYQGTVYMHRIQENASDWLHVNTGDNVIYFAGGRIFVYTVTDDQYIDYGIYPEVSQNGLTYIASCFSDRNGEWAGIELYRLQLVRVVFLHTHRR